MNRCHAESEPQRVLARTDDGHHLHAERFLRTVVHLAQQVHDAFLRTLVNQCHATGLGQFVLHMAEIVFDTQRMGFWRIVHHAHAADLQEVVGMVDIVVELML